MTDEQYKNANRLNNERNDISKELGLWEDEITSRNKLGYLQGWNNNHPVELKTQMSTTLFNSFRDSVVNELKLKLIEIDNNFKKI